MKKLNLTLLLLIPLIFMGCNDSKKSNSSDTEDIKLEVTLEQNMSSSHPLDIIFKLTNLSDKTVYYYDSHIPFGDGSSLNIFEITEDGVLTPYEGPTVYISGYGFNSLEPGDTFYGQVSLDKYYGIHKGTHNYKILYLKTIRGKTSDGKAELLEEPEDTGIPKKPNELTPKNHTSRRIQVKSNTLEFEATINEIRKLKY